MKVVSGLFAAMCAFAGSLCFGSSAVVARTNWQGEVMITAVTNPACASDGWAVGGHALSSLLPANVDNNGGSSFISFHINRRNAYSLKVTGALAAGKAYTGIEITSAGSNLSFSGNIVQHTQTPAPANVTTATKFITVTGQIAGWAGTIGCTITYEGAFVRRR